MFQYVFDFGKSKDLLLETWIKEYAESVRKRYPADLNRWERLFAPLIVNRVAGTVANLITVIRILLAVIVVLLLVIHYLILQPASGIIYLVLDVIGLTSAFVIFIVAGLLDLFDGPAARALNQISEIGKMLDPLADKILLASCFIILGKIYLLPFVFWAVFTQEIFLVLIACAKLVARRLPFTMASQANNWGKRKNVFELVGGGFLFLCPVSLPAVTLSNIFLGISIPFALGSICGYLSSVKKKQA